MTGCNECANFKPRRTPTGWVCRECRQPCVNTNASMGVTRDYETRDCPWVCHRAVWKPFYGRVVE